MSNSNKPDTDEQEKAPQSGGLFSRMKSWLPKAGGGGWKVPAAIGVVGAILFGGPIGIGIAAGAYASAKVTGNGPLDKGKNAALMATGAAVAGGSAALGALIGSLIFPIVGTVIGALLGAFIGMKVAEKVTAKVRDKYLEKPSHQQHASHQQEPGKGHSQSKGYEAEMPTKAPVTPNNKQPKSQQQGRED